MYLKDYAIKLSKEVKRRGISVYANSISEVHMTISDLIPLCFTSDNKVIIVDYVVSLVNIEL